MRAQGLFAHGEVVKIDLATDHGVIVARRESLPPLFALVFTGFLVSQGQSWVNLIQLRGA